MRDLLPLFLNLTGRRVLLVGGGAVAEGKLRQLLAAGAIVRVVAPAISSPIRAASVELVERAFQPADLDDVWLVVAAATPAANRAVAEAAERRRVFVNAVDDPANATAFLGGVVRRDGVTLAVSTSGEAPALSALVREGLDAVLPREIGDWLRIARDERAVWRREHVAIAGRKPLLLRALNRLYERGAGTFSLAGAEHRQQVPWLNLPEDSWL
jgi:siroheme synthase-like protein